MTKTLSEQAMEMYQRKAYHTLKLFKKRKKKSWSALGINPKMEALIMKGADTIYGTSPATVLTDDINVGGTVTGRNPILPPNFWRMDENMPKVINYKHREINKLMSEASHNVMAHISAIREQEKLRADPRFPFFLLTQQIKRYKAIFAGRPYLPIFS